MFDLHYQSPEKARGRRIDKVTIQFHNSSRNLDSQVLTSEHIYPHSQPQEKMQKQGSHPIHTPPKRKDIPSFKHYEQDNPRSKDKKQSIPL